MTTTFVGLDPYKSWLNVRSTRRPLDAYALLGLAPFEDKRARIQAAILRQRSALESHRENADPEVWNRVYRELEDAIETLADHDRKAILDAELRRAGGPKGPPTARESTGAQSHNRAAVAGITCRHCEQINLPDRSFCAACGKSLWESCPNCRAAYATSERFCGGCGINLADFLAEQQQHWQKRIDIGRQLQAAFRFMEAQIALREVAKLDDPRYDEFARQAATLMQQFQAERQRLEQSAQSALEEARQLVASYAFDRAIAAIDAIPEPLRGEELRHLLQNTRDGWREIQSLTAEVRAALDAKKTLDVLPKLDRLLTLKPDYEQAKQLGQQLASRIVVGVKRLVAEQKFDEATKLLHQIPSFARNPEVEKLAEQAAEVQWLLHDLRTAPLVTRTLLAIADRALKILPNHPEVLRRRDEILQRAKQKSTEPWRVVPDWAVPPQRTTLGFPVDWLGGLQRIAGGDVAQASLFREHPGRWFVALGLALQGLGQAAVNTNMMPQQKSGVLGKLSFSFRRKPVTAAWGIDLSPTALKAIKLRWDEAAGVVRLEVCELIEHETKSQAADDEHENGAVLEATVAAFLARQNVTGDKVCVNLPGLNLLGRFLQLPPVEDKRLDDLVTFEARQQIPFPLEDLLWDYECLCDREQKSDELVPRRVLVIAAKEQRARPRLSLFEKLKVKVDVLQCDCVALHNLLRYELSAAKGGSDAVAAEQPLTAVLDVGSDATNILVSGPNTIWFRTIGLASDEFTQALVRDFRLTREQAEQVKRDPTRARRISQLYETLDPVFAQLVGELQRSLVMFKTNYAGESISRLFGVGGGFQAHGLLRPLRHGE